MFDTLTADERHKIIIFSGDDFTVMRDFSVVVWYQMSVLSLFSKVAPTDPGKLFVASGFLTMLETSTQGSWQVRIQCLPDVLASARGVLSECLLTSDGRRLACLRSAAELDPDWPSISLEKQKESLATLQNLIETVIPNIDDTDPARLKLRAKVLGLRGCGNIKCTTLRPSSKKSFGKLCAGCQSVRYCGAKCQKADWKGNHKGACKLIQAEANS